MAVFDDAIFDSAIFDTDEAAPPPTAEEVAAATRQSNKYWRQRAIAVRWKQPFRR